LPGGAGEMIAMSDSLGADVRLVTVMQYGRLLAILATISAVGHLANAPRGVVHLPLASAASRPAEMLNYLISVLIAITGAALGTRFRIPAGTMIIPAALAAVARSSEYPLLPGRRLFWQVLTWFWVYRSVETLMPQEGFVQNSE
jgi:uncharacterized membrane protein AbrB (regulator of aidB expression)